MFKYKISVPPRKVPDTRVILGRLMGSPVLSRHYLVSEQGEQGILLCKRADISGREFEENLEVSTGDFPCFVYLFYQLLE